MAIVFFVERSLRQMFRFGLNQTTIDLARSIPFPLLLKFIYQVLFQGQTIPSSYILLLFAC